jgi:hypothetical protein
MVAVGVRCLTRFDCRTITLPVAYPDNLLGFVDGYLGGVFDFFISLLEVARIAGNRVEKVEMVRVAAVASAKTIE